MTVLKAMKGIFVKVATAKQWKHQWQRQNAKLETFPPLHVT